MKLKWVRAATSSDESNPFTVVFASSSSPRTAENAKNIMKCKSWSNKINNYVVRKIKSIKVNSVLKRCGVWPWYIYTYIYLNFD